MKILVVGAGAREHALAWRLSASGHSVLVAPGNPGMTRIARCQPTAADDVHGIVTLATVARSELVVVGPEAPLAAGLVDALEAARISVFGPTRAAARLESSKVFAKEFMRRHGIPTADFRVAAKVAEALDAARAFGYPVVLKADGLAAGKGVLVAADETQARTFARECLEDGRFGESGTRLVVEEFLPGEEVSLFFLSDGERCARFPAARDYKRLADGDKGPNTGGMGAFAPAPLDPALAQQIEDTIALPTLRGMAADGASFRGLLYVGLMLGPGGPRVLEYNVRFGDPETQVLMPLVANDLGALFVACATGELGATIELRDGAAVGVVLAAPGYPGPPRGGIVTGLESWPTPAQENKEELWCFHAATRRDGQRMIAAGGRVVTVVARAATLEQARTRAYEGVARLALDGAQIRRDIAAPAPSPTPAR
jgi:phosphoribosylamine--glycine ligase